MPLFNLDSVLIKEYNFDDELKKIICSHQEEIVCNAIYLTFNNSLTLNWIETNEKYQAKGIASKVLDFICDKALINNLDLIIKIVDESTLNTFYYKWFIKKFDPNGLNNDEITEKFNSLFIENDQGSITFTLPYNDLLWQPSETNACFF